MSLIFSTLRFAIYFSLSFLILCFPIKEKQIFDYLEVMARPLTKKVYFFIDKKAKEGIEHSKKFFTNSAPLIKDKINSSLSSAKKEKVKDVKEAIEDIENYTEEEREAIKKILSTQY